MKEVLEFLNKNPMGCLATADGDTPHVRPWGFMCEDGGALWFCTSNRKKVFEQLMKNPKVEFVTTSREMVTVRISGEISFSKDPVIRKKVFDSNELVKSIYRSPENPVFEVFCLGHGSISVTNLGSMDTSDMPIMKPRTLTF